MSSEQATAEKTVEAQQDGIRPLLAVRDLRTHFFTERGVARAVDGVSFEVFPGETLGVVGESGCGKSVTALSILRLVTPPGRITGGTITLDGQELTALLESEMRRVRGRKAAMIFQEPQSSLNPVFSIGFQITEAIRLHQKVTRTEAEELAIEMLGRVAIPDPAKRIGEYPHQLSGGMKQRAMIAMALSCRPSLLIADEPTTALDVTIQAQILNLLQELREQLGMSVMLITHNLGIVAQIARRVMVMYAGKVVETASTESVFHKPLHPYTVGLFRSLPKLGRKSQKLAPIPGEVPNPLDAPPGCRFQPRCGLCVERCRAEEPKLRILGEGHSVACHVAQSDGAHFA
ncbi:MAG TPA: ABC transporter ATP-binding protein [Candidatus Brocadiia bacterium]|nr:ABC transporter ATP-binding protein [Candidatus Brocadiia bacterium]